MKNTSTLEWELARTQKFKKWYTAINYDKLKVLQNSLIEILLDFDKLCKENNIDYVIVAGTLIGAVRHEGFIPWDDDIDIVVMRDDYLKIKKLLNNHEFSEKYEFILPESDKKPSSCGKFMSKKITLGSILGDGFSYTKKIYIDVLPVDYVPKNKLKKVIVGNLINILSISYSSQRCYKKNSLHLYEMAKDSNELKVNLILRKIVALPAIILGSKKTMMLINFILEKSCKKSNYVTIALGVKRYFGEILLYEDLFPSKFIKFEGHSLKCPNNAEKYLSNRYGDYMEIPPEKEQMERLIRLRDDWRDHLL